MYREAFIFKFTGGGNHPLGKTCYKEGFVRRRLKNSRIKFTCTLHCKYWHIFWVAYHLWARPQPQCAVLHIAEASTYTEGRKETTSRFIAEEFQKFWIPFCTVKYKSAIKMCVSFYIHFKKWCSHGLLECANHPPGGPNWGKIN